MSGNTVVYINYLLLAVYTAWCAWNLKRLLPKFRMLALFIFFSAGLQIAAGALAWFGVHNLFLSHIYSVLGFIVLINFYRLLLRPFIPTILFRGLLVGFCMLAIATVIFWEPLDTFNSIPLTAEAVVFIIFSLSAFILTLNEELNQHLRPILRSLFWINSGIFLYFTGSLLLFYNGERILRPIIGRWSIYIWLVHAVLAMVLYTTIMIGIWLSPKE